jgi:putative sterol carrier protein
MANVESILESIRNKFSNPDVQEKFKDVVKQVQFEFTDVKEQYFISIDRGSAGIVKGSTDKPDVLVSTTSDILEGIMNRKINPVVAYSTRKIKVKGSMEDLLRLQKLML